VFLDLVGALTFYRNSQLFDMYKWYEVEKSGALALTSSSRRTPSKIFMRARFVVALLFAGILSDVGIIGKFEQCDDEPYSIRDRDIRRNRANQFNKI
jgi:hypothetical protein